MMRIFSGIQPTNQLHIGNYLGAIKQWVQLQKDNECIYCIVDLHALTIPYDPKTLQQKIKETSIAIMAAGIDPEKSIIFVQSQVKEHAELGWLFNTITPIGELERMTQYKDKSKKFKENINAGLLDYPVLQTADVLLYKGEAVPVGKDQEQHIELMRTLARKFNQKFGQTFKEPASMILKEGAKIMSLVDPKKKMSKSDEAKSCIFLFDSPEDITKKIMSATTDSGKEVKYNLTKKPGISNLLMIYSLLSGKTTQDLEKEFVGKNYGEFKKSLAQVVVQYLEPFRRKQKELMTREVYVQEILKQGQHKAQVIAQETMREVREKMGLI
ncbi:MAG: tryptophan--tRNA ligase [Candidatus Staskawiczbacteria bacterium RIFCSPHIGHO2_02_FULL_43_16]|uniref:Tryptophan--tRNA ligase n=1 Tax=Candidatus Staskawiczbacteria bacterium RIFCSPHIGHO2_01_FULL_41_41 TaxID=1802203 RepID=A0A1G2HUK1_9BACT|nr:MAG: tryptophan--tRNA ligase [Candidatus Staskawiczbacteria bacterium RIFCSPHIGHO2_01_FULL_41_41]OGZ68199.1 MAG: tryptophan--tRNA ligase [Candidatus Staskawiczbacteria bacterium RIFCSPHIGHO2_02_FULL_43_16]OGZ74988.1 MAG: tryptophan--tRNA ligase [Candidatus Staskawiczbacteria bacterium RIFCSPLOWO2_01_FULL_43_17b]